ncbi:SPOR domain-containing protein [Flavobacterium sp. Arc2]|jgi:plasmid maintenance system killer protein|uniref:SPOR domain-containing protein n=1 Tax=Flavobacterium sp. Arc2 TaxID=3046685 RepID=UPI00352FAD44
MKIITIKNIFYYSLILSILSSNLKAQDRNLTITQDPKFEQLLNEKRKTNVSITVNERYKIQIFSGDSDKAKKTLNDCKQDFLDLDGTIVFNTPNYKVWVGNFRTKIEAERNLIKIRRKYENAYLIKPQK